MSDDITALDVQYDDTTDLTSPSQLDSLEEVDAPEDASSDHEDVDEYQADPTSCYIWSC